MVDSKLFYVDVETTGLDSKQHDILQLAYIIEINGEIKEEGELFCQPFRYDTINAKALEVNKLTIAQIKQFQTPQEVYTKLIKVLDKYVDKYNKNDKFSMAGYNVRFDHDFLNSFFLKNGDKYCFSYFDHHLLSVDSLVYILEYKGLLKLESCKLINIAKYFNIDFLAHDALADIKVTRQIFQKLLEFIK